LQIRDVVMNNVNTATIQNKRYSSAVCAALPECLEEYLPLPWRSRKALMQA